MKKIIVLVLLVALTAPAVLFAQQKKKTDYKLTRTETLANAGVRVKVTKESDQMPLHFPAITPYDGKDTTRKGQYVANLKELWSYDHTLGRWIDDNGATTTVIELTMPPLGLKSAGRGSIFLNDYTEAMKSAALPDNDDRILEAVRFLTDAEPIEPKFIPLGTGKDPIVRRVNIPAVTDKNHGKELTLHLIHAAAVKNPRQLLVFYWSTAAADAKQFERIQAEVDKAATGIVISPSKLDKPKEIAAQDPTPVFTREKEAMATELKALSKTWNMERWGNHLVRSSSKNKKLIKVYDEEVSSTRNACERYLPYESTLAAPGIFTIFGDPEHYKRYIPHIQGAPTPEAYFYGPVGDVVLNGNDARKMDKKIDKDDALLVAVRKCTAQQFLSSSVQGREVHPVFMIGLSSFMRNALKTKGKNVKVVAEKDELDKWIGKVPAAKEELITTINGFASMSPDQFVGDKDKEGTKTAIAESLVYFMIKSPSVYPGKKYENIPLRYLELLRAGTPNAYTEAFKSINLSEFAGDLLAFYADRKNTARAESYIPPVLSPEEAKAKVKIAPALP